MTRFIVQKNPKPNSMDGSWLVVDAFRGTVRAYCQTRSAARHRARSLNAYQGNFFVG